MLDCALADDGLRDAANIDKLADIGDLDFDMHRDLAVGMDLGRHRDVYADIGVGELGVHQWVDAHATDTGLEAASGDRDAVTDTQVCLVVVSGAHPRRLQQLRFRVVEQRRDLEAGQCGRPAAYTDIPEAAQCKACRIGA